ncbi:MAG: M12 family metallopeptidase [Bdellovibrio sp.]
MRKTVFIIGLTVLVLGGFFVMKKRSLEKSQERLTTEVVAQDKRQEMGLTPQSALSQNSEDQSEDFIEASPEGLMVESAAKSEVKSQGNQQEVRYKVEEGLAIINEDIVVGVPEGGRLEGRVQLEEIRLWPQGIVPFHIQADLDQKERVIEALAFFSDTPIQFVPYEGQEDVLVFESAKGGCRSYLGKVGGKQPVWISPGCSSRDIAHEIMHALGFIHEQNRSDRDAHVEIVWRNIQKGSEHNFEIFPASLMKVSGVTPFDFESIMLYQSTVFSKNGEAVIKSREESKVIAPSARLSVSDHLRLDKIYGSSL